MTISAFANQLDPAGLNGYRSVRDRYRQQKRWDAEDRQDAEVARTAAEQNCSEATARDVVRSRRRFEHRTGRRTPISATRGSDG